MKLFFSILAITFLSFQNPTFSFSQSNADTIQVDEFKEWNEETENQQAENVESSCAKSCPNAESCHATNEEDTTNYWIFGTLIATILAGIFVRFKFTRNFRNVFLLSSIVFLGFYLGACPCPISHFENSVLFFTGVETHWENVFYFLLLIPITYLFGKVWCGWICHLGAIQEFLYLPAKFKILQDELSQKILKYLRYVLIFALILQLIIQKNLYWCSIDPFWSIFNLDVDFTNYTFSAILVILILLTSLFSFRPFCRAACPIGISLGWISAIPGASIIGIDGECASCKMCNKSCEINAITKFGKNSILDNKECIACGDCIDNCSKDDLQFKRKKTSESHIIQCGTNCTSFDK